MRDPWDRCLAAPDRPTPDRSNGCRRPINLTTQLLPRGERRRPGRSGARSAILRERLKQQSILTAPFKGRVGGRLKGSGVWLQPGAGTVRLVATGEARVRAELPEQDSCVRCEGTPCSTSAGSLDARSARGRLVTRRRGVCETYAPRLRASAALGGGQRGVGGVAVNAWIGRISPESVRCGASNSTSSPQAPKG